MSAESLVATGPHEKAPTDAASEAIWELPFQPVLLSNKVWPANIWSSGSGNVPIRLKGASARAGPEARMSTVCDPLTWPTGPDANPAKRRFGLMPTSARAERLVRRETLAAGLTVTVAAALVADPAEFVATQV